MVSKAVIRRRSRESLNGPVAGTERPRDRREEADLAAGGGSSLTALQLYGRHAYFRTQHARPDLTSGRRLHDPHSPLPVPGGAAANATGG